MEPLSLSDAENKARLTANLGVCVVAGLVGSSLGALANLLSGKVRNAVPLLALCAVCALARWLLRRGRVRDAALVLLVGLVGCIHARQGDGQGGHDRAAPLYPAASSSPRSCSTGGSSWRRRACTCCRPPSSSLEQSGALQTPWAGRLGWLPVVDLTIIFVVTAVAVCHHVRMKT